MLAFEFQINGRVTLTDPAGGLHQSNLTTTADIFAVDGVSMGLSTLDAGQLAAIQAAVQALIISNQSVPV